MMDSVKVESGRRRERKKKERPRPEAKLLSAAENYSPWFEACYSVLCRPYRASGAETETDLKNETRTIETHTCNDRSRP